MTIKAEIMIGQCDATFMGRDPLQAVAQHGKNEQLRLLYSGGEQRIDIADFGRGDGKPGEGGAILFTSNVEDVYAINFEGHGLKGLSTNLRDEKRIATIAILKPGGEVTMHFTSRKIPQEPAIIKFTHTVDNI